MSVDVSQNILTFLQNQTPDAAAVRTANVPGVAAHAPVAATAVRTANVPGVAAHAPVAATANAINVAPVFRVANVPTVAAHAPVAATANATNVAPVFRVANVPRVAAHATVAATANATNVAPVFRVANVPTVATPAIPATFDEGGANASSQNRKRRRDKIYDRLSTNILLDINQRYYAFDRIHTTLLDRTFRQDMQREHNASETCIRNALHVPTRNERLATEVRIVGLYKSGQSVEQLSATEKRKWRTINNIVEDAAASELIETTSDMCDELVTDNPAVRKELLEFKAQLWARWWVNNHNT